jgi:hypothetical protein
MITEFGGFKIGDRLSQIKQRLAATTPGQWYVNYLDDGHHMNLVAVTTRPDSGNHESLPSQDPDGSIRDAIVATTLEQAGFEQTHPHVTVDVDESDYFNPGKGGRWDEDAQFIANAKDDIQFLIDLVEELTSGKAIP